jgi:hypothetical protein
VPLPLISPGHKWWQTVLEIKVVCSQWQGSGCAQLLYFGVGGGIRGFFSSCSQCVPIIFTRGFQRARQVPNLFPTAPQFYPKQSCIPLYTNWKVGEHIWFYLATWGPKRCFYWGVPNVRNNWWWVNQSGPFQKKFVLCLSMPLSPTVSRAID